MTLSISGWESCSISDISLVVRGITFPANAKIFEWKDSLVCCLRTSNIQNNVDVRDVYFVEKSYVKRDEQLVKSGDILMSMANSYELVGKVARVNSMPYPSAFGAFLAAIRPTNLVDGSYLFNYLKSSYAQNKLREGSSQTTNIANISAGTLGKLDIPLPPLAEQRRIAKKLDTVLTRVDALNDRLARITPLLKRFRQSVLAAATSGRLTEDWRLMNISSYPSKEKFLQSILESRQSHWVGRGRYKPPYLPTDDEREDFKNIPSEWIRGSLELIAKSIKDGPHFSPKYEEIGIPFLSARNIRQGFIDFSGAKYISRSLHDELSARCKPEHGDVLYTKGGTTGLAAVNSSENEFNVWVHVAVLKLIPDEFIDPYYLQHSLNSPVCYKQSQEFTHGVGNQDLGLTRMAKIILPLPSRAEQTEIVRRVEILFAYADRLEARLQTARTAAERLTPALLAKAFRGELVPQDPNDEPATELLRRLREARAAEAPAKKARGRKVAAA